MPRAAATLNGLVSAVCAIASFESSRTAWFYAAKNPPTWSIAPGAPGSRLLGEQANTQERTFKMNQYQKLYTPADSAIVFIDHQPQMIFGVANADRATLINNVTLLAKVAKEFKVPAVLTAVETESFSGYVWPQLLDVFPGQSVVERTSMNSWDDPVSARPSKPRAQKNIIMTGLWTEVCVTWPTIEMLGGGLQHLRR